MSTFPFLQVDAFTSRPLTGNACAVVFDPDAQLDADTMLAIAREMNLSETSFVRRSSVADFGARYFTPGEEIPLAGHPTIATAFALVATGRLALREALTTFSLELPVGPIRVDVLRDENGGFSEAVMWQKRPAFGACYPAGEVMPAFGLTADDALPGVPLQTVSTGTPQLMIPVRNLETLRRVAINFTRYGALRERAGNEFFSAHLFCVEGATGQGQTFARHFAAPPGPFEDPFTGSATGGMGAYLWHHGLIAQPRFTAEQGHWMQRPGQGSVEAVGPRDAIETVKVGGGAVGVLRGELTL